MGWTRSIRYAARPASSRLHVQRGAIERLGSFTARTTGASRVVLVSDRRVGGLYAARALRSLRHAGLQASSVTVPNGERSKSPDRLAALWESFADAGLERGDAVVALGGGVVGDLAGFAAATFMRGLAWVCVPTSLVAQVDSSIGGKTAIDLRHGKNLAGAFHQPAGVLVDPAVLRTLSAREYTAGLAEIAKAGMAVDGALFRWLERHVDGIVERSPQVVDAMVVRSIRAKMRVVAADEREREGGVRAALNFGHTVAHALEAAHGYRRLLHGEAVAIGLRVAVQLSVHVAGLASTDRDRLVRLLDRLGLPRRIPGTPIRALETAMAHDKKARGGVRWVLTPQIGRASVPRLISGRLVQAALLEAGARVGRT